MRTTYTAKLQDIEHKWYLVDAANKPLGRLASMVATLLRGKHKPMYTPHMDVGDYVVVLNAEKIVLTGKKAVQKMHYRHSGYPGGLKKVSYGKLLAEKPERAVYLAVKGMLPHNRLGRQMVKRLRVYRDENHSHEAQQPEIWEGKV